MSAEPPSTRRPETADAAVKSHSTGEWTTPTSASPSGSAAIRGVLIAGATVGCAVIGVRAISLLKETLVASVYGRGDMLDVFLVALLIPSMIGNVVGGALHQAFLPCYARTMESAGPAASQRLLGQMLTLVVAASCLLAALIAAAGELLLPVIGAGFPEEKRLLTLSMLRIMSPIAVFSSLSLTFACVLNARGRFAVAAVIPAISPLVVMAALLVYGAGSGFTIAFATVAGSFLEGAMLVVALTTHGCRLTPLMPVLGDASLRSAIAQWLPAMGGAIFQGTTGLVDQAMAGRLLPGSVSTLGYSLRIVAVPIGLVTIALGTGILPTLSTLAAGSDAPAFWQTLRWMQRRIFWGTTAAAVILALFAAPVVRLLYQRGHFGAEDTAQVSRVVAVYAAMLPFYATGIIGVKALSALGMNRRIFGITIFNLLVNVGCNLLLAPLLGPAGIALSSVCVYAHSCFQIQASLRGRMKKQGVH